ncbi:TPA: hypothetical protein ACN3A1_002661 [Staphylococcus aureus]|uniref:hypothetical protein n=1 Tax=Staphylococcus aureus TaxID=1280 RepID=UPI0015B758D1|nr:hypothetical protein [Staphylococcus aureus]MDI1878456.1 hypothetical protein [Staphylococcus aureus]HDE4936493.1 hypothetical protein [Staphylococcus aureus]HDE6164144.1 hypothetical protein [Staphylococcus aureus]HDF1153407.1 hypothetical protein [Staphylococcus aureus]HDF3614680.1 hypothetical protein [Staphylococcus aureus]
MTAVHNIEAGGKSAYYFMQVGGAPTQWNWIPNFYRHCKLGKRATNSEAGGKSAYNNVQVGGATT